MIRLIGFDVGLATFGWAVMKTDREHEQVVAAGVVKTEQSDKKRKVLRSDDNVRRSREIAAHVIELERSHPGAIICIESLSWPRNASSAAKVALSVGVVSAIAEHNHAVLLQASPQEVKLAACRSKSASKDEVEAAMRKAYPEIEDVLGKLGRSKLREHAFDAVAVVHACLKADVVCALRARE